MNIDMHSGPEHRVPVYQAAGIVSVQVDCTLEEALDRISKRAEELGRTLDGLATDIVSHRIWFR